MAYVLAQTRVDAVFENGPATATGLLGTALCGLLAGLLAYTSAGASERDEGLDELAFMPGMVLALGSPDVEARVENPGGAPPSSPLEPAAPAVDDTPAADDADDTSKADDAVTDETTTQARPISPSPKPSRPSQPTAGPARPSPLPTPPGPIGNPSRGSPFGDPNGLDDLARDGDPWARGVIAALQSMEVGTVYGHPIAGNVRFQLTVCKDGTISRVAYKGGSAGIDERDLVLLELGRLKIPRPPASIAAGMRGHCAKLMHTFSWTVDDTH